MARSRASDGVPEEEVCWRSGREEGQAGDKAQQGHVPGEMALPDPHGQPWGTGGTRVCPTMKKGDGRAPWTVVMECNICSGWLVCGHRPIVGSGRGT